MLHLDHLSVNNFKHLRDVELRFPRAGSILIEGRNEAGKTTLFEAIFFALFGRPLISGTAAQDLVAYDATEAIVELTIATGDCRFVIQRKVKRTKTGGSTNARLRIAPNDGAAPEDIRGSSAVNQRIQQELKLDADAFLNSCFVEQKKLEKLEGMSARDRETSLMRLLNLDRMLDEEKDLKLNMDDTRALARLEQRVALAETVAEIPAVMKRGRELNTELAIVELKEGLARRAESLRLADEAAARSAALDPAVADLESEIRRVETLSAAVKELEIAAVRLGRAEQARQDIGHLRNELDALDRLEHEELPALQTRLRRVAVLRSRWSRLKDLEEQAIEARIEAGGTRARLEDLAAARAVISDSETRLVELSEPLADVEARLEHIASLHAAVSEVKMAGARLGNAEQSDAQAEHARAEMAALDCLESDEIPALEARIRSAGILRGQWARILALRSEAERLQAEAAATRERLALSGQARAELSEAERQVREDTGRVRTLEAEEEVLSRREHAANLRQALEDWRDAARARDSLSDLTARMAAAQAEVHAIEAKADVAEREAAGFQREVTRWTTACIAAAVTAVALLVAINFGFRYGGLGAIAGALLGVFYRLRSQARRSLSAAQARHDGSLSSAAEARNAFVRLEGQRENAVSSSGAAAGRLEHATVRFEALDETPPASVNEAERRLAALPEDSESPAALRDQAVAVRTHLAAARAALEAREANLDDQRKRAGAENETVLRAAAERLESRATRITETILDRWTEAANARAAALGISAVEEPETGRNAASQKEAALGAQLAMAKDRLNQRPALARRMAETEAAANEERAQVAAACGALAAVRPDAAAPATRAEAAAMLQDLGRELQTLDEPAVRAEHRNLVEQRSEAENERAIATRRLEAGAGRESADATRLELLTEQLRRIGERIVPRWTESAATRADALRIAYSEDTEANRDTATRAESVVEAAIGQAMNRLAARASLVERVSAQEASVESERRAAAAALRTWPAVRPETPLPETRDAAVAAYDELRNEVAEAGEETLRSELRARREEKNAAENERVYHQRAAEDADARLRATASRARIPEDAPLTEEALAEALPAWPAVDAARKQDLLDEYDELKARHGYLNGRKADLGRQLGLDPDAEKLDPEKERADRDALARDHRVREQAVEILRLARDRILDKVLPYTLEHMRRILPALTMDRYHDAKLTADFKIEVWDERAGMWKAKNIFSGGTRDQFSLALRLAFAIATLPQERGAAPGFIFLDEPLSSFDTERSDALMYLLTRGEIADTFDQIFVISHNQSVAAKEFQQRLVLDSGRISDATEDLRPTPALELDLADVEEASQ